MNSKDIPAELTVIHQMIVDHFNAQPFIGPSITVRTSGVWSIYLCRDYNEGDYEIATAKGDTPAEAIAKAKRIIAALPDENTQKKRDWQKKLGSVIDEGHDLSLPDDVLSPLRAGSQAMTQNLLTSDETNGSDTQ